MKVFINGKSTPKGRPFYSLMEMSAASGLPIYEGGPADIVFNWGGGGHSTPAKAIVLNRNPIFDKFHQAKAMLKVGMKTPRAYDCLPNVKSWFPVVEKPLVSFGGHGIRLITKAPAEGKLKEGFWYQGFIDKVREFRVYFFNGRICMIEEKIVQDKSKVTWNFFNCLRWQRVHEMEGNQEIRNLVILAAKAIRVDWGAADVMQDKSGSFWICEVNSRPSCWGGKTPKLPMQQDKNGVFKLLRHNREDLDLSARMWANRMNQFVERSKRS